MNINQKFKENKEDILGQWFEYTINSYPEDTAKILKKTKNQFDNPVGSATLESLKNTLDYLIESLSLNVDYKDYVNDKSVFNSNKIENALDSIIRIRAVQNFSASQAVAFVFELKNIVKSILGEAIDDNFDTKVDIIALAAFNRFMKCRENIFLLKATEAKRRIHSAFERAGLITELTEEELVGSNKS